MPALTFIQYLRPDGRKQAVDMDVPPECRVKADFIMSHGFRFECEVLMTEQVSLTIGDDDGDYAFELVANGPGVPAAVEKLVRDFDVPAAIKQRAAAQA